MQLLEVLKTRERRIQRITSFPNMRPADGPKWVFMEVESSISCHFRRVFRLCRFGNSTRNEVDLASGVDPFFTDDPKVDWICAGIRRVTPPLIHGTNDSQRAARRLSEG